ncbi:hypothetical protein CDL12_29246 [Handroanthus impetiginosus]|uniref:DUF7086 domain-containing protein n=1 Tax=Handroanthus impetiginosus TaxID=429701 RepID=A0A2G9FYY8_9LAMI|nr:hypothetical protein CDL12_29246 [Handroanthus impetiginosus]
MSHTPFPNNNGHNISEDFLNLTLSLSTWSSALPLSDAGPRLPRPSSPRATSNLSSVLYEVIGNPLQHQQYTVVGGTAPRGPTHHQRPAAGGPIRNRRSTRRVLRPGQSETITPPYPWATDHRAIIHDLQYIKSEGIITITGKVKCTECNTDFDIKYDLQTKFEEVQNFVIANKDTMWQRAPEVWKSPAQLDCQICNQKKCVKPILGKKRSINWLFLLLGQMIGCCKLAELKYFCKHTGKHNTGAKDRVLYLTYMELCRQLDPLGDYDA